MYDRIRRRETRKKRRISRKGERKRMVQGRDAGHT